MPRGGIRPRTTRGRAAPTEARRPHPCARQAGCVGEGTRPLRLRVLAPCRRTKAQKPAPRPAQINAWVSNCLARPCPPRLTPQSAPPAASVTIPQPRPASLAIARGLTSGSPAYSTPRLPAPPTHILGVDVCPNRHQRLRRLRVASSSRRVQGRFSLRGGRRVRLVGG